MQRTVCLYLPTIFPGLRARVQLRHFRARSRGLVQLSTIYCEYLHEQSLETNPIETLGMTQSPTT